MSNYGKSMFRGVDFENFIFELFKFYKIENIKRESDSYGGDKGYDFCLNNKILVEVRAFYKRQVSIGQLLQIARKIAEQVSNYPKMAQNKFLLIVANVIDFENVSKAMDKFPELKCLEIIDVRNLFYLIRNNDLLIEKLISMLDYSTEDIEPLRPELTFELFNEDKIEPVKYTSNKSYIEQLTNWEPKSKKAGDDTDNYREFEKLCVDVLNRLLRDNLMLWKEQQKSNDDLYQFDLICKIKSESSHDFWNILKEHFDTRYIIFEFKNYKKRITQKEVYTTEKYLYGKALRSVAIVVSPEGEDKNSKKAIKGTLRENGKVILSLKITDLIKMLKIDDSSSETSPSDFLSDKLDELLINLDK